MMSPRFLMVKFSAIGDCVMAAAAASAVRRTHPNAFICWAIDSRCAPVVDTDNLVDLRYDVPRQQWKAGKVSWLEQYRHFAQLRRLNFDYGLDLQGHSKTALCLRIAQPKKRVALRARDVAAWMLNPVAASLQNMPRHTVERNLFALRTLGDFPGDASPIMPKACPLPADVEEHMSHKLVSISISAGHPKKCYAVECWLHVAQELRAQGYDVAFLGGPEDRIKTQPQVHDWIGRLDLGQTMSVVARSRIHIAADTGTGHMAAAYGVPVVSVFGYTDKEEFRPYTNNAVILDAGRGMDRVTPSQIVESTEALLARQRNAFLN